jgi:leucyl-tRNA synthetase
VTLAVQVMGKMRGTLEVQPDQPQEMVETAAKSLASVAHHLEGKTIRKVIFVPNKIINFVAS